MKVLRLAHHAVVSAWRERERELRARGIDVALLSSRVWNEGGTDVRLHAGSDRFVRGVRTVGRHPSVFLFDPFPIWRALGQKPDLIDLHEEPNALVTAEVLFLRWLRRSHVPYVLYSAQNLEKRYPLPFRWFERIALRGASGVYVCNSEAGDIVVRKGLAAPALYIPLGVDLDAFAPARRAAPSAPAVIGYVGRLEPHKGVDVLLRAIALSAHTRLKVTGEGSQRSELVALAAKLGVSDRVEFLGYADGAELTDRYRELDALVVPSLPWPGWSEQFCRVAVEAMASGVPVVASASGAIPDVVAEVGLLVPPGDPVALEQAITDALEPARWFELRRRGLARAGEFSWARVAELQQALYERVLGRDDVADPEILIVAYGLPDQLAECLAVLGDTFSVTIIDNSSLPATRELVENRGARYVDAGANLGFAGGVNLGLRDLAERGRQARNVVLLNPDARVDAAAVHRMQQTLHSASHIAAVGATQIEPQTGATVRVWWPFPTPWGAWIEAVGLGGLRRSHGFAIGSVLLLRAEALQQVGHLDEQFFLYAEETDWQFRARRAGWTIAVAEVAATHVGAGTGGDPGAREAHFYGSAERYVRKHYGVLGWSVYRAANVVGAGFRARVLPGDRGAAARRRRDIFARGPVAGERRWM